MDHMHCLQLSHMHIYVYLTPPNPLNQLHAITRDVRKMSIKICVHKTQYMTKTHLVAYTVRVNCS